MDLIDGSISGYANHVTRQKDTQFAQTGAAVGNKKSAEMTIY